MPERRLGADAGPDGVTFRVWAPDAGAVEVSCGHETRRMLREEGGVFAARIASAKPGDLYSFRVDGGPPFPDPASRFQPQGVHGPSQVVDPRSFRWTDAAWAGVAAKDLVVYELHVGTFTPEGTFAAATREIPRLAALGVTALELMPVNDFPGRWNWGYDPAAIFAPSRAYGRPDDLRRLVDAAHAAGIAVLLDVVYNHFAPDGAYAPAFSRRFFTERHKTPWGPAINLDAEGAPHVRAFFVQNAMQWLSEYHLDGLRLDATFMLKDDSPVHFLAELASAVATLPGPKRRLVAEDDRNLDLLVRPRTRGGYALDAVWADDFHHVLHRTLTGERHGYYGDFGGGTADLARTIAQGWLYTGQHSPFVGGPRGTSTEGIPPEAFVFSLQNHDQVGNRAAGNRLGTQVGADAWRAASALLLFLPQIPLLFMGQEWGSQTPFQYFTDHEPELGRRVTKGRREEFGFADGVDVPDPQDPATFARSRLDPAERARPEHAAIERLYADLLARRRNLPPGSASAESPVDGALVVRRGKHALVVALRGGLVLPRPPGRLAWTTERAEYLAPGDASHPPEETHAGLSFARAGAAIVESA